MLEQCGCKPLQDNEQAMRVCTVPTCFYMPHCPFSLYNNLVYANWAAPWLVAIIGNDWTFHALHNHPFTTVAPHLHHAMQIADAARLPDIFTPSSEIVASMRRAHSSGQDVSRMVSSSQIFGLSTLYTFPPRHHWEGLEKHDALSKWLSQRPELPTASNFVHRLERELEQTQERVKWLVGRLAREKIVGRL